jgi:hypothetical protein
MEDPGFLWVAAVAGGPILLAIAIAYGVMHRRRRRAPGTDREGQGTAVTR